MSMKTGIVLDRGSSIPRPPTFNGSCEMSRAWWGMLGRVRSVARKDSMILLVTEEEGCSSQSKLEGGWICRSGVGHCFQAGVVVFG